MKKILIWMMLALPLAVASQPSEKAPAAALTPAAAKTSVEMSGGKTWLIVDGKTTLPRQEIDIGNTRLAPDGTVTQKDGKKMRLKNGDKVNEDGSLQNVTD